MRCFKTLLLSCLLLVPLLAGATETPTIYTIKKGDTLWGISQRFISDPWYWPSLWANNPLIRNPHLIYPGQKLAIYDGRIELLPASEEITRTAEPLPTPVDAISFEAHGDLQTFISADRLERSGRIVDTIDNRILMTQGDEVFVQMSDAQARIGARYRIYSLGELVRHPATNRKLGHQLIWLGELELTAAHEQVYSARITQAAREIERGSLLLPPAETNREIDLKRASQVLHGTLVAAAPGKIALGQHDVCHIDLGRNEGLEVGNMLTIVRPRQPTERAKADRNLRLPDSLLGRALVVRVDDASAVVLILKASEPVYRGDLVYSEID
ncbi:MAG: LysM peptidoglycan-binding domain-containing protein [Desulfuromonas thiophila]|jgi:LysM repeat protein/translation initiation factor IF-1|nr:LysM peptidoglycan-binding domain-containing protein [Desulfuromonas thiophila]MDY0397785.1 LysM peptidoglycan-binding domain-containing protein [Desulfuromonas thiophila]